MEIGMQKKLNKPKSTALIPFQSVEVTSSFAELEVKALALAEQLLSEPELIQKTKLDHVGVTRLLMTIQQHMEETLQYCLFEQNDDKLKEFVKGTIEDFLEELYYRGGIHDYVVICDETNNTPHRVDQGEMYVDLAIKPVRAAKFIQLSGIASGPRSGFHPSDPAGTEYIFD
jgi:hypothetical protein